MIYYTFMCVSISRKLQETPLKLISGARLSSTATDFSHVAPKSLKLKGKPAEIQLKENIDKYWLKYIRRLPLSKPNVVEIQSRKECDNLLSIVQKDGVNIFGFDTEGYSHRDRKIVWRNWNDKDKLNRRVPANQNTAGTFIRCIQIADLTGTVYFVDLFKLSDGQNEGNDMPATLIEILESKNLLKLVWDSGSELIAYENTFLINEQSKINYKKSIRDAQILWNFFKPDIRYSTSLRQAVYTIFGHEMNKSMQLNDWNKIILEKEQIEYACFDALATLDVALAMKVLFQEPDWMVRLNEFPKLI